MKVKDLIKELLEFNQEAEISVIVYNCLESFTLTWGDSEGSTKKSCTSVGLYVDRFCDEERSKDGFGG